MVYSGYGDVEVIASNLGISLYFIKKSSTTEARFITSCVGVNAVICIRSVSESSFKRSAFAFAHSNKRCR